MIAAGFAALAAGGWGQAAPALNLDDWTTFPRPDLTVVVQEHALGPDLVEISLLDGRFSPDELRSRVEALCQLTGEPARGLDIRMVRLGSRRDRAFLKASFGTGNIIRLQQGLIDINPILKAFAAPSPSGSPTQSMIITIAGLPPSERTLRTFESDAVAVSGRRVGSSNAVEYRAYIKAPDPEKVSVPIDPSTAEASQAAGGASVSERPMWIVWVLALLASAALAALVYSLFGRLQGRGRAKRA
jgi:hypothetical protein